MLEPAGIGVGIVKGYDDLASDPYLIETGYYKPVEIPYIGEVPYPAMPFTMSESEASYLPSPKIGEHNYEILNHFLGMDANTVESLTADGVLYHGEHVCNPPKKGA